MSGEPAPIFPHVPGKLHFLPANFAEDEGNSLFDGRQTAVRQSSNRCPTLVKQLFDEGRTQICWASSQNYPAMDG